MLKANTLIIFMCRLPASLGGLHLLEFSGSVQPCTGIVLVALNHEICLYLTPSSNIMKVKAA